MNVISRASIWLASTSLMAAAAPALSQSAPPAAATPATVGEVVVTAQRRAERLQDVPIAVSVVTGDVMKQNNINGLADVAHLAPALTYNEQGAAFQIRGVGTQSQNGGIEQDVAVVLDEVVQGITEIDHGFPYYNAVDDVDRVEILEGPQGTLFGKNSSAGVLNITTKRPVLGQYQEDASVSYGSRNEFKASAVVNIPLGSDLAFRASAYSDYQDGLGYNEVTKSQVGTYHQSGVSLKLLWKPTDKFTAYLIWTDGLSHTNEGGVAAFLKCGSGDGPNFNACAIDEALGVVPGPHNTTIATDNANKAGTHKDGATLHLDYLLPGGLTVTSVTGYFKVSELSSSDVDGTPLAFLSHFYEPFAGDEFTQEVRLSSPSDQFLEYTLGAYYYQTVTNQDVELAGTLGLEPNDSANLLGVYAPGQFITTATSQSYAAYGQATLHLTDHLRLIGGLRGTHDLITGKQQVFSEPGVCQIDYAFGEPCIPPNYANFPGLAKIPPGTPFSFPTIPSVGSYAASNVSGKVGVQYDVTRDLMGYVTFATGYKGPAPEFLPTEAIGSTWLPIKPETNVDYEAGVKSQWFERRLTVDADIFYTKYTNFQANYYYYDPTSPALSQFVTGNAGALETKGIEAQVSYVATPELTLSGSVADIPTKYLQFDIACNGVPGVTNPATPGSISPATGAPCFAPFGSALGANRALFNAAGYPLAHSPQVNYNLTADYHHEFGNGMVGSAHVNWNWRSQQYYTTADPNTIVPGYGLLDASLGFGPANGRWKVSLFGRNLLNQFFPDSIFQSFYDNGVAGQATPRTQGYVQVVGQEAERTVGIKLEAKFR